MQQQPQPPYQQPQNTQPGQQPYYPPPQASGPVYPPGYAPPSQPIPPGYGWPQGYAPPQQQYPMQGPYQPPYYPYQQPGWPPLRRMNHHAELAQLLGFCSLFLGVFTGIPAIILGLMALGEIRDTGEEGTGRANAGLILGIISLVWTVAAYYWFFVPR